MNKEQFNQIIEKVISRSDLTSQDIPDLDLYIDQIMTLFDQHLDDNKRYEDDKLLTKTMINNYSKAKVISPVKGKKYTKEQIMQMLFIYYLKNNLTIQEIKKVLTPLYQEEISLQTIFDHFIEIKRQQTTKLQKFINENLEKYQLDLTKQEDQLITIMMLASLSNALTGIIELMVDEIEESA